LPDVAGWLIKQGYAILRFDHRGFGDSEGPKGRLIPMEQVEDLRNAITFMQQQPGVNPDLIGLWGAATGGANATYTAGIDQRVKCIVAVSAAGDCGRWIRALRPYWNWVMLLKEIDEDRRNRVVSGTSRLVENGYIIVRDPATVQYRVSLNNENPPQPTAMMSLESAEAIISYRPEDVASRIAPRAGMWVFASGDTLVPVEESQRLFEKAGEPKKLVSVEGELHHTLYHGAGFEKMMTATGDWFREWLR